jgi:2-keto-4-pentenoate hydratase/2-oxohepta-3-ene-1,7-dioic acid hydratase in catechol pathway
VYLASFSYEGRDLIGFRWREDQLVPIGESILKRTAFGAGAPQDMLAVIDGGPALLAHLGEVAAAPALPAGIVPISAGAVRWHPPVRKPGKILGVAMNNSASDARKISAPPHPMFFMKPQTSLLGHLQEIEIRSYYGSVHPEPELAVVIGRRARDLDPGDAMDHVFGYSIMNDMTGNAMRSEDRVHYYALYAGKSDPTTLERREQHLSYAARYKGTDGFGPMGPWLVTRDEIPDPGNLDVLCKVGADVVAEDSTRYLTYSVPEILAFISRFQTLEPGDVISMGTAFRRRPGAQRTIHSADLQRVDGAVCVEITGLGTLCTPVRRKTMELGEWQLPKSAPQIERH